MDFLLTGDVTTTGSFAVELKDWISIRVACIKSRISPIVHTVIFDRVPNGKCMNFFCRLPRYTT